MSDTVPASAIIASLADGGPSFILDLGAAAGADAGDFHVGGRCSSFFRQRVRFASVGRFRD